MDSSRHLDDDTLAALAAGGSSRADGDAVDVHIDECAECRALIVELARGSSPPAALDPVDDDGVVIRGDTIGRFMVLGMLGDGAGGVVYAAHDPDLDRKVAIKVLHDATSEALREAQTLAKLSHPNVLAIYEAGTERGRVYLAIEHVDGLPLDAWLAGRPPWSAIRDVLVQVARGLTAAHVAGVVHRDVKPANILVGKDRRTWVADFGLAITGAATGRAGTPAYMAPEQREHGVANARSDQYAFGLVVREAVADVRPPAHVTRAIERMLAVDPAARYPDLRAVERELERDPTRTVKRALVAAGGVGAIALAAGLAGARVAGSDVATCDGAAAAFATAWSPADRLSIDKAFSASGRPYASRVAVESARLLDDYGRRWRDLRTESCRAEARDELTREHRDRTFACLDLRRASVRGVVDALAGGAVDDSLRLVEGLPSLTACTDHDHLRAVPPPAVAALHARIAGAAAELEASREDRAEALLPAIVADARASGDDATIAEALGTQAELLRQREKFQQAEQLLYEAARRAGAAGDDALVARNMIALLVLVGYDQGRFREGDLLAELGEAVVAKASDDTLTAKLAFAIGDLRMIEAKAPAAEQAFVRAIAALERTQGPEALSLITYRARRAYALGEMGDAKRALPELEKAVALARRRLGNDHPETVDVEIMLGVALDRAGQPAKGRTVLEGAIRTLTAVYGPRSGRVATALATLASVQQAAGELALARTTSERALAIHLEARGPNHVKVAVAHQQLGAILAQLGETSAARAEYREAIRLQLAAPGHDWDLATSYSELAFLDQSEGKLDEARALYDEALAMARKIKGERHRDIAALLSNRAQVRFLQGDRIAALEDRATSIAILEETLGPDHPDVASALTRLANETDAPQQALERALEILIAALGPNHLRVGQAQHGMAVYALEHGDSPGALAFARAAAATAEASLGSDHPNAAVAQITLGVALAANGDILGGLTKARAAIRRFEQHHPAAPKLAPSYVHTGKIALRADDKALAREMFERARERYLELGTSVEQLGDVELELAKLAPDRTAALALGKSALGHYLTAKDPSRVERARAWLSCAAAAHAPRARCSRSR